MFYFIGPSSVILLSIQHKKTAGQRSLTALTFHMSDQSDKWFYYM